MLEYWEKEEKKALKREKSFNVIPEFHNSINPSIIKDDKIFINILSICDLRKLFLKLLGRREPGVKLAHHS